MRNRIGLCALLIAATSGAALADGRVRTIAYEPSAVVKVTGRQGFQSSILFRGDEKIENVAVGDSLGWQITPNKRANVLFLKPVARSTVTNMTVVTDKRIYLFDLLPSTKNAPLLYSLRFEYAEATEHSSAPPANDAAPAPAAPAPVAAAETPPASESGVRAADINFAWRMQGAAKLLPAHVFDDGHAVYLDWEKEAALPAILTLGPDGSEGPVNFSMRGRTIVIDGVARELILRLGKESATLTNLARAKRELPHATTADARSVRSGE